MPPSNAYLDAEAARARRRRLEPATPLSAADLAAAALRLSPRGMSGAVQRWARTPVVEPGGPPDAP